MITSTIDLDEFRQQARRIRARVPTILSRWGLVPKFTRWRLTQDPETGLAVLFAVLNNKYIATHTSIPFSDYFDPRLLHDMGNDLNAQVVSCNTDGLRYAFILDRGSLDKLPTHIEFPFLDGDRLFVRVVYNDKPSADAIEPHITPAQFVTADRMDDQRLVERGVRAFLKVFDDNKLKTDATLLRSERDLPDIVVINEDEFHKRVKEHEANRQRINHIRQLLASGPAGNNTDVSKKMEQAMLYALVNGGKLRRYPGGFWAMENWQHGQNPWFGTSTIKALVSRGLMLYTEWHEGRKGRFPVAAVVPEPPDQPEHSVTSA